jgi:hypothetical protein
MRLHASKAYGRRPIIAALEAIFVEPNKPTKRAAAQTKSL